MSVPTPSERVQRRRPAIDVARILALTMVVLGHLVLAVIDRSEGELRGANLIELHPGWEWLAILAPMPVFFAAAGWANAGATAGKVAPRLRSLVGSGAVVIVVWSVGVIATTVATGDAGIVGDGARIATQPLWFLAAYVPFAAAGAALSRVAVRFPRAALFGGLAFLGAVDAARFALGAPEWIGWPAFFVAWGLPWLVGAWWRDGFENRQLDEKRAGFGLALFAGLGCAALVWIAGYSPALIDAVPGARSNTTPPTLYTAAAGLAQAGVLLMVAGTLDLIGRRWRRLWDRAGEAAVGVYLWHLTALALCAAALAGGLPAPERLTALWWLTRPAWWLAVLATTALIVAVISYLRARVPSRSARLDPLVLNLPWAGVVVSSIAAALVGIKGPRSIELAVVCSVLFLSGWWLLTAKTPAPIRRHLL